MEDWQGCLSPLCQTALQRARDSVAHRGGYAITVEDFLLALLDGEPVICDFLRGCGVDLDELTRTIQCEQPIVTEVGGEGLLSSQLMYWFSCARELSNAPWLDWPVLLSVLTRNAERLQEKAYVAVLELVSRWPAEDENLHQVADTAVPGDAPVVITDLDWLTLAEDVAITLASVPGALVWVRGPRGSGKTSWLQALLPFLESGFVRLDLRNEAEVMASDGPAMPVSASDRRACPALVLDNISPVDLAAMLASEHGIARGLVTGYPGPIIMLGPDSPDAGESIGLLERFLGRDLDVFDMPATSSGQKAAILTAHQPAIERHWNVELSQPLIRYAASSRSRLVGSPGGMIQWVERAAARLNLFAERGSIEGLALAGTTDTLRRQALVAMARNQPLEGLEQSLEKVAIERAAAEVAWHERKAEGTLRRLKVDDLRHELERWVAARPGPVHYVVHCDQPAGETEGAGSRNLHS
ncbi:Clp protease N-terminal domain-containing protein [Marinobacter sp. TBZ242]|uniref:Clp protease N-terminal domain-containing protein n=1 Tax=Marinobacter azerbaijanicus TaxID=3050455 RepID=A0ABT7I8Z9_9GAMM|nr:Clp protease N-terminal domain-containing protein [Marinobacter sp. TBZ242]MDL0430287.1 Clp protease N-terminal domain-containing protein [Marinobacter sp. TBZ242]